MIKRLANAVIAAIILVAAAPLAQASAQSMADCTTGTQTTQNQRFNPIISGLWAGINFDFGGSYTTVGDKIDTATACAPAAATQQPAPENQPNTQLSGANIYAALGDSVAAGVGLPNVSQVPVDQTRCGRTQSAYPYEVAATLNLGLVQAACSGATAGDLFTKQRSGSPNLPPQLDAAFARGTPGLITITAGANDAHWVQFLQSCYVTNCASETQTKLANAYLIALQAKLLVLFPDIQVRSHGKPPKVIMTGYYNPISANCTTYTNNLTQDEITWMTAEVSALNQTIQQTAANFSFVRFAPVDFSGHDVCSADSWVQGPNDPQPFHPTVVGQHAIAQAVLNAYRQ